MPEVQKSTIIFDNLQAWYFRAGEQPVLQLFEQFFVYADYLLASDEFRNNFKENSVMNELYSLMELIYEASDGSQMEKNKYFQRDSIEGSPVWKLIRRLAQEVLVVAHQNGSAMTVSFEEVICL